MMATFCARTSLRSNSAYSARFFVCVCGSPPACCAGCPAFGVDWPVFGADWPAFGADWPCAARFAANNTTSGTRRHRRMGDLLLHLRWIILEDLVHGFSDALVPLLRLRGGIDLFRAHAPPDDLVLLGIGHVDDHRAD